MQSLNYHHLHYFFHIAREGSIAAAAKVLCVTPQTLSGLLAKLEEQVCSELFDRKNKKLVLNSKGRIAFKFAEEIFNKGQDLLDALSVENQGHLHQFNIGVTDSIPKVMTFDVIKDAIQIFHQTRFVFKEGNLSNLHHAMQHNKVDFILTDRPSYLDTPLRVHSHFLGETGISFFAKPALAHLKANFPYSLDQQPLLLAGDNANLKKIIEVWFIKNQLTPHIVAEFEDSALLKLMGGEGYGIFTAPSIIEKEVERQYNVVSIGQTDQIKERYYAIVRDNLQNKPLIQQLLNSAKALFEQSENPNPVLKA